MNRFHIYQITLRGYAYTRLIALIAVMLLAVSGCDVSEDVVDDAAADAPAETTDIDSVPAEGDDAQPLEHLDPSEEVVWRVSTLDCGTGAEESDAYCIHIHETNNWHCDGDHCYQNLANGMNCNEHSDCASGTCCSINSNGFCCASPASQCNSNNHSACLPYKCILAGLNANTCATYCTTDDTCYDSDDYCTADGRCVPRVDDGGWCNANNQCNENSECKHNVCCANGDCCTSSNQSHCGDFICNTSTDSCYDSCSSNYQCRLPNEYCSSSGVQCHQLLSNGWECKESLGGSDCGSGHCNNGICCDSGGDCCNTWNLDHCGGHTCGTDDECNSSCINDSQCVGDFECFDGDCKLPNGAECGHWTLCNSRTCNNGVCCDDDGDCCNDDIDDHCGYFACGDDFECFEQCSSDDDCSDNPIWGELACLGLGCVYPYSWGLDRINQVNLPLDNDTYTSAGDGAGRHIYIVGSGIAVNHPEFSGRAQVFHDYQAGGDGLDCTGTGTHAASVAAGISFGFAKHATVHSVRALGCAGDGTTASIIDAIHAVEQGGVHGGVVLLDLGGGSSAIMDSAVENLHNAGFVVVAPAGNENSYVIGSPARAPQAIAVGAIDDVDTREDYSNKGPIVDIFAPGADITGAWHQGGVHTISGTGSAAAYVAGVAAVICSSSSDCAQTLIDEATSGVLSDIGVGSPNLLVHIPWAPHWTPPL